MTQGSSAPTPPKAVADAPTAIKAAAADPTAPLWLRRVPLLTGILAALAGFLTVRQSNLSNEAIYHSNQGVLYQAQSSDTWAEYQADSIKARIVENSLDLSVNDAAAKAKLQAEDDDLRNRQKPLQDAAKKFADQRDAELQGGQKRIDQKDLLNYAGMAIQLGIALASVAALTRRKPAFTVALGIGAIGAAITAYAVLAAYFSHG
jgi:flagellar basal body-associated protein FliL